jgi:hypothetical protein
MRKILLLGLGTLCAAVALDLGCSSSSSDDSAAAGDAGSDGTTIVTDGGSSEASTITAAQACSDLANARCAKIDSCGGGFGVEVKYGDLATCESRLSAQCVLGLAAPNTGATPANREACSTSIAAEDCPTFLGTDAPDPCVPPAGTLAAGSACGAAAQCQSTYCAIPVGSACGTCATAPVAGDPCTATGECGGRAGLVCAKATGTCVTAGVANASCDLTHPCAAEYECVRTLDAGVAGSDDAGISLEGKCQLGGTTVGTVCRGNVIDPRCEKSVYLTCEDRACAQDSFADAGAPCGDLDGGAADCLAGGSCQNGTCVAPAAEGSACDTVNGPTCLAPARCIGTDNDGGVTGTCTLVDPSTCK